ncbi:replication factor A [Natrinema thermotolerans]|uniref:Replication factor A n=1 Tax=Natrinema thermotolerans TaxID=121872 RepID=A0AAF0PE63_9EURY|nr:replication factor A [Natrinema thermotolerans]QCC58417.1 replication factor A [Natrinema thermotolerans]WMT09546.1 replication factor A [Natrinema thermotolerans]
MSDVRQHADDIHEQFSDHLDVDVEDVEERLTTLVDEYKVPMDEARRSVTNHYLEEAGLEREDISSGDSEKASVEDVDEPEEWIDLTAKVIELWDPRSDSVAQVGLLGDPTGTIKFTKWAKSDLPALEEGTVYELRNVVTDEYQGRYSVKLNSTTVIEELEEDLEVGNDTSEVEGALVDMQSGSGLIKRCPEEGCTRVLQNGRCNEHGEGEGEFDLRIKAVVDDGIDAHEVIFDKDATENLTGLSLEEAKEMAMDALDTTIVADEIREDIVGTYYRIEGPTFGRYVLADDVEELDGPIDGEELLIKARSM